MNNEIKDDLPANWPVWTRKIVNNLQAAEDIAGKWFLDKAPDWAARIWVELIKLIFPTVHIADYQESGARFTGALLGHHQSLLKGENGLEKQVERVTQAFEWLDDELKRKLNKKAYRKLIAEGEKLAPDFEKFFEQFDKVLAYKDEVIKSGLKIASEQIVEDQTKFYEAYSRALKTEIYDEHGTSTAREDVVHYDDLLFIGGLLAGCCEKDSIRADVARMAMQITWENASGRFG
ncbi:MAG: hypothetical protein Q7J98_04265 [Kiritimatiellia bacterium]|nr:hypothetical protein [Kiritimatiellia bacterium]